ncbi:acyltransferase-domain-containing protein [Halteromyces radiatus]|uniref:acyltransferase-domain-containing protein n=1 Tax=Halteromyces radiatus TaxID=101107 RepID=UPI0022206CB6|nr:acyltransferase-domain-containing protein [Halteromyces radiatus]KAI8076812.1 acyltransferase-domain-containing protein [Halteromyces radiatus]
MRIWSQSLIAVVQYFAPASLVLTFDDSCLHDKTSSYTLDNIVKRNKNGDITNLVLPDRIIVTSNHQINADWAYIWCVSYLAKAHGAMKIILKDSLKHLPVYGLGMQFFDFIFLKRKMVHDRETIVNNLVRSKQDAIPLWLVLFPEGTVLSSCTRKRSKDYAEKNDLKDLRNTLLPRSSGLQLCLQTLDNSVDWVYDFTIGYPGVQPGENPEDIYTIQSIFFFNKQPKHIHIHVRRFHVNDIPVNDDTAFSKWIYQRWVEKDNMMAYFYKEGRFPTNDDQQHQQDGIQDLNVASPVDRSLVHPHSITVPIQLANPVWKLAQPGLCVLPYLILIYGIWYFWNHTLF